MNNMAPYLMFNGDCEAALKFYQACLGGEIPFMGRYSDGPMEVPEGYKDKIMHASLMFWGGTIMASDHSDVAGYTTEAKGSNIHLSLHFESIPEMESTFNKLKEGGTVTLEPQDMFWGDRFGMLKDKFGINWMFTSPLKKSE